jgi:hypothetical protein
MHTIKDLKVFLEYLSTKYDEATIDEMQIVFKTELDPDEFVLLHPCPCETQIFITKDNEGNPNTLIVFGEHYFSDDDDNDETILHQHQLN